MNRALAYFSIITTLFFLAAVFILLFLAPEVDPMHSGISFYALTKYAPVIDLALALVGLAGISLGIALWSLTPTVGSRIGIVLLVAWGCASILAGAYPVDALKLSAHALRIHSQHGRLELPSDLSSSILNRGNPILYCTLGMAYEQLLARLAPAHYRHPALHIQRSPFYSRDRRPCSKAVLARTRVVDPAQSATGSSRRGHFDHNVVIRRPNIQARLKRTICRD